MKVTLMVVTSLDGKTTDGSKPGAASWASPQDQALFKTQTAAHDLIVMGSKTYTAARSIIRPDTRRQRVIMTRMPQKFVHDQQPGLIFSADSPKTIVDNAITAGCASLLLVGGAMTNAGFLNAGLVDELLVTVEPLLFGGGEPLTQALRRAVRLELISCRQLNAQGTILAHYRVQH